MYSVTRVADSNLYMLHALNPKPKTGFASPSDSFTEPQLRAKLAQLGEPPARIDELISTARTK